MDNIVDLTNAYTRDTVESSLTISDNEDEELKLAIALSLQDQPSSSEAFEIESTLDKKQGEVPKPTMSSMISLLGLDRKAMEAERIARLKRKRAQVDDARTSPASLAAKSISPPPLRRRKLDTIADSSLRQSSQHIQKHPSSPNFSFPKGNVLLTSTPSRCSISGSLEAISFSDVLKPPAAFPRYILKSVLLSTFITDFDWALSHFNTATVKFVLILHAQNVLHRQNLQQDFTGIKNVRIVTPEICGGFGTMHSKVILLFFEGQGSEENQICRVVVPSANLVPFDWGVGGVMENVLYIVDLPFEGQPLRGRGWKTQFERELKKQLLAMGVPDDVLRKLDTFDFRATNDVGFVHTVSDSRVVEAHGSETVEKQQGIVALLRTKSNTATTAETQTKPDTQPQALRVPSDPARTGLLSLSDTIAAFGLSISRSSPSYPPKLDFITSSLGNLSTSFIHQLYQAACGSLDPSTVGPASRRTRVIEADDEYKKFENTVKQNLSIYFPSWETVQNSKGGQPSAGTICFQKKWWEENVLIRESLRDCVGVRGDGILMHSKILYVRFNEPLPVKADGGEVRLYAGWVYVGSANLSESAWGRITSDGKSKKTKMTSRNWESGVIIPVSIDDMAKTGNLNDQVSKEVGRQGCERIGSLAGGTVMSVGAQERSQNEQYCKRGVFASSSTKLTQAKGRQNTSDSSCTTHVGNQHGEIACSDAVKNRSADLQRDTCKVRSDNRGMKTLSLSEVFSKVVPVPMLLPASSYLADRNEPWFFKD